jgi:hypothetical protein
MTKSPFRQVAGVILRPAEDEGGFGFRWRAATIAVAGGVGLLVALLLLPVAAILALPVAGIWAIMSGVRARAQAKRREQSGGSDASEPLAQLFTEPATA